MNVPDFPLATPPELLMQSLLGQGAVLLRGAFAPQLITSWLPAFLAGFADFDARYAAGELDDKMIQALYNFGHTHFSLVPDFIDWLRRIVRGPELQPVFKAYFGARAWVLLNNCSPRREGPEHPEHAIPFHQDQEFIGPMERGLTLWVPLTPAGGDDWPGLEFWLGSPQIPWTHLQLSPQERDKISQGVPPEERWRPQLWPGDVMIFTPYTLHRTHLTPAMRQTRFSSEIRMISDPDLPLTRSRVLPCDF